MVIGVSLLLTHLLVFTGQPGMAPGQPTGQAQQWMARPEAIPGCPPGLEYLTQIDQLLVHQQIELLEGNGLQSLVSSHYSLVQNRVIHSDL